MDFVREYLENKKNVDFKDTQKKSSNFELEVLADTVYVKGDIKMRGIKKLTVFSRKVISGADSRLDLSAPTLEQKFELQKAGDDGDGGTFGVPGPIVEIYADVLKGDLSVLTSGGKGNKGQDGKNGIDGNTVTVPKDDRTENDCFKSKVNDKHTLCKPSSYAGIPGQPGDPGSPGGYAGKSGNGGNAGYQNLYARQTEGKVELKSCRGSGAPEATNGKGGIGGPGGKGGKGVTCKAYANVYIFRADLARYWCGLFGTTKRADPGDPGNPGTNGHTPEVRGSDGEMERAYIKKSYLSYKEKMKYPLVLLKLMKRHAEDVIWANNIEEGKSILEFLVDVTEDRADASKINKVVKLRLGFLNNDGFDRFGKNKLFAPLQKWTAFKEDLEEIKTRAMQLQNAYNGIQQTLERKEDLRNVVKTLNSGTSAVVQKQRERLEAGRLVANQQKDLYVRTIRSLEGSMGGYLDNILNEVPSVWHAGNFNKKDFVAVLQGITGFLKAGFNPLDIADTALGLYSHFGTKCDDGDLKGLLQKVKKWVKIGKKYEALKDSNDLNFDEMDIESVPEMMKARLEMNKEGLAKDLVCLLELANDVQQAKLNQMIENFFIAASTRIDLIAKVLDLDNDIGTFNFDIENLAETENQLSSLGEASDSPIADDVQQTFLDNLLQSYRQIETHFTKKLYLFYKAFEFQSLWNGDNKMSEYQRGATIAAKGTGQLQGVVKLSEAIQNINEFDSKLRRCFTVYSHSTDTHKWSFNKKKHGAMFDDLYAKGNIRFTLKFPESDSSKNMYNMRLLKMFVEFSGEGDPESFEVPSKVYLKIQHMSASYFRDGSGNPELRQYRQYRRKKSKRLLHFNRLKVTDEQKCNSLTDENSIKSSYYCVDKEDSRFEPMCCHSLVQQCKDESHLGAEECQSLFGTYELSMPVDPTLDCSSTEVRHANCKDFDRTMFTKMTVWAYYLFWADGYPTGPDDLSCQKNDSPKNKSKGLWSKRVPSLKHKPKQF
ncbi:hypothetical protein ACROYT_G038462 [Oculina patagonica]